MKNICVVHLVRAVNGPTPLKRFLDSYKMHSAGVDHDLLIVFKGYKSKKELIEHKEILIPFKYISLEVSDEGYDLTAYFKVAKEFNYNYFIFLNSYSEILANDWLLKMYQPFFNDCIGAVGATGSYQSMYRDQFQQKIKFPTIYNGHALSFKDNLINTVHFIRRCIQFSRRWVYFAINFSSFPNPHIRTNAFMIRKSIICNLKLPQINTKMDAWLFESGRSGLSASVKKQKKKLVVVGRNGCSYDEDEWFHSNTYKQANQDNLLIADNQTNVYQFGDVSIRKMHASYAWGTECVALTDR